MVYVLSLMLLQKLVFNYSYSYSVFHYHCSFCLFCVTFLRQIELIVDLHILEI